MNDTGLLIVADDLTGGLDTGVQFAKRGIKVRVFADPAEENDWSDTDAQVIVAVSNSRHMKPEMAYQTVHKIVSAGKRSGIPYVYKKTDSALRGNIGAELSAALDASGEEVLSFLPAYPAMNRVTIGGFHYIDGVPVDKSVFGSDPFNPVYESDVRKLIGEQTDKPVLYGNDTGKGILLIDSETEEEMRQAGLVLLQRGFLSASAGCAGFAALLPELLEIESEGKPRIPGYGKGLLVISGSLNPITMEQLNVAESNGFTRIRLSTEMKLGTENLPLPKMGERWLIIDSSDSEQDKIASEAYIREKGWTNEEVRLRVAANLGNVLAEIQDTNDFMTMIIGGDTMLACLKRIGCSNLEPLKEPFPGVVLSKYNTGGSERLLISKSGGFGNKTLLTDIRNLIEKEQFGRKNDD